MDTEKTGLKILRPKMLVWLLLIGGLLLVSMAPVSTAGLVTSKPAPEFTQKDQAAWLSSKPLRVADLRGKVVLLDFWTFECWNCYRSFPWLTALEKRYKEKGLQVIGIHTPEFEREKVRENIEEKMEEFGIHHPVMMDNNFAYWNAMNNRYWPAFYLIDKQGNIRASFVGETHEGDRNAEAIEKVLLQLLAE